jgi:hypothetical protein
VATRAGATIAEAAGSHVIYVSKPEVVAALIAQAVEEHGFQDCSVTNSRQRACEDAAGPNWGRTSTREDRNVRLGQKQTCAVQI